MYIELPCLDVRVSGWDIKYLIVCMFYYRTCKLEKCQLTTCCNMYKHIIGRYTIIPI